ncbi:SH3 domain protein [Cooperia oncophora]
MTAAPPRPAPKPGRVRVYRALYDYEARTDQEMSFVEGDLLYVSDSGPNDDWLPASCGGKKGLVPANYGRLLIFIVTKCLKTLPNPLHEAARRGNVIFLKDCIANQVSVNSLDKSGSTACTGHVMVVILVW